MNTDKHNPSQNFNTNSSNNNNELTELRRLLLGFEYDELTKLQERLNNLNIQAEDISQLLPEAIILRSLRDKQLSEAIVPTVEEAIQSSVRKDFTILSDALFPIIGPASRKAIATALEATVQSLNQAIEYSFSFQSLKWRIEARQTGKSFGEVVLMRTLLYRVEQVFLIHKKTGLLLQHLVAPQTIAQDADLVSAMLTAIEDFVKDSFNVEKNECLDTLQFGELTIWIEAGPQAIVAGIIRGNAPRDLRFVFQQAVERTHLHFSKALSSFKGDPIVFDACKPYLQACLKTHYKPKEKKGFPYILIPMGGIAIALGIWSFFTLRDNQRWSNYLDRLNTEQGLIVISTEKRQGKYYITGLRDPLAIDPTQLIKTANIDPATVVSQWKPYLSLDTKLVTKRAINLLQPPQTITLSVDNNYTLIATGFASQQWILKTHRLAPFVPGVVQYQEQLTEEGLKKLESIQKRIEAKNLYFKIGTTKLELGQEKTLQQLVGDVRNLYHIAQHLEKTVQIQINGYTDNEGSISLNKKLSKARANAISSLIISKETPIKFSTIGFGRELSIQLNNKDKRLNRRVSFKVILSDNLIRGAKP